MLLDPLVPEEVLRFNSLSVRSLTYGGPFWDPEKVLAALIWCVAIIAVTAPLAVRIYRRKV